MPSSVISHKSAIAVFFLIFIVMNVLDLSAGIKNVNPVDGHQYRPILRTAREGFFNFIGSNGNDEYSFNLNMKRGKLQRQFKASEPFLCDVNVGRRSQKVPDSVHKLLPGDIDIIGAFGDSLTAGNGAMATNILQIMTENKGMSWSIGGQGTWRKFLTLPNILKEYNPNIYGYSLADGLSYHKSSVFNVAEIGAMSRDIPYMAKVLVKRMKSDPKVDIKHHWKLITLLIGANDFCSDMCYHDTPEVITKLHEKHLLAALRTIRDNLPRTIVNVVSAPDVTILLKFTGKPMECVAVHYVECPCFFSSRFGKNRKRYVKIIKDWHAMERNVTDRDEFHNLADFTVNYNPFTSKLVFPLNEEGRTDFRYLSMDCFHLSQRGYAIATNGYWNNMMEPYGNKSTTWSRKEFVDFKCPTKEMPYLRTKGNS
ncbi:phospholipase B1, membrane-associated-like [Culicoides brevitarsis]|uniref:phospholipase B1, membrane-associated-like n=1 Tax=Culicoides brevitarsis TaxID=469753 RepID=UPI00307B6D0C